MKSSEFSEVQNRIFQFGSGLMRGPSPPRSNSTRINYLVLCGIA